MLGVLVVIGTFCDLGKILIEKYESKYIANSLSVEHDNDQISAVNSDEKLRLIKTYRENSNKSIFKSSLKNVTNILLLIFKTNQLCLEFY